MLKFYKCNHCGNVVIKLEDSGVPVVCCGEPMVELVANKEDASVEKHVPVVEAKDGEVLIKVGEVEHPMTPEHMIKFIVVDKGCSYFVKTLDPGKPAEAVFAISNPDKIKAVYEYCNLHGLWVKEF